MKPARIDKAIAMLKENPQWIQLRRDMQLARTTQPETLESVVKRIESLHKQIHKK